MANALADLLNGLNNSAASTVSAPVDGISWLLRKAGMGNVIGNAPVGGSEWMQQQGLTRPTNGLAGDVGEFAGNLLPIAAAAKAPEIASGLLKMGANALAPTSAANLQRGAIDVYHGSPHSFDKFDMGKIGTGEGAQAYGHGLYFAESPGTAAFYRDMDHPSLGVDPRDEVTMLRQNWQGNPTPRQLNDAEVKYLMQDFQTLKPHVDNPDVVRNITRVVNGVEPGGTVSTEAIYAMRALDKQLPPKAQGNLYNTRLAWPDAAREAADPLGPQHFLQWDKPLSEQPANVQKFFEPHVAPARASAALPADPGWGDLAAPTEYNPLGQELMHLLRDRDAPMTAQTFLGNGLGPAVSNKLRQAGIPGIRYLDGGSRGAGTGTSNYVVFDDALPKILERNGKSIAEQFADKYK